MNLSKSSNPRNTQLASNAAGPNQGIVRWWTAGGRSKLLIVLLGLSFAMLCTLGWQAYSANTLHHKIAHKVLGEYAELAATEFSRRLMSDIGYRGYFQLINQWKGNLDLIDSIYPAERSGKADKLGSADSASGATYRYKPVQPSKYTSIPMCQANNLAKFYFAIKNSQWHILDASCKPAQFDSIKQVVGAFDFKDLADKPFAFIHTASADGPVSLVLTEDKVQNVQFGFVTDRNKLQEMLAQSFEKSPLLPKALADGKASNHLLKVNMQDHLGNDLLGSQLNQHDLIVGSLFLSDEYSGIFRDHKIFIGIDKDNAESLIIGGLPGDKLPIIGLSLLLTLVVFISSFIQLKKEYELNEMRSNFVAQVSHELRTPLTQIRMFGEMLEQGKVRNQQESQQYLSVIVRESIRLNYLIENVLRFSRTSRAVSSDLSSLSIKPIVLESIQDFNLLLHHHQIELNCQLEGAEIIADALLIKQVLSNLLDNAIKYGPEGQTISIKGKVVAQQDHAYYSLMIVDQGKGIPVEEHKNIWLSYYRLNREYHDATSGTGIGLSLVKQLMAEMKGKVSLNKDYVDGCKFELLWPMNSGEVTTEKSQSV